MPSSLERPIKSIESTVAGSKGIKQLGRHGPIHIVHLVIALNVGGLEQVVIDLVRRMDRARFRNTIVCIQERGLHADQVEGIGVPVISLECGTKGLGTVIPRLVRALYYLRPDILHTHNPHPHLVGSLAGALLRLPTVLNTKHGRNKPGLRNVVRASRLASLLTNRVIAVSLDAASVATGIERVPRRKVQTIHNGIDLERFPLPDRTAYTGPIRAIHVARLNVIKDQSTLLRAVREVVHRQPEFRLTIVGDGPIREELHSLCESLGLVGHVHFLGDRRDIPTLLANADLFVLSSIEEGLSLTLLEAMASGLAVVATDVGGNREVVLHGKSGLLVPSRSPERLAEAILHLAHRPNVIREMGRQGRVLVEKHFNLKNTVRRYEDLYESSVRKLTRSW
jgi:sugar transferase (PEP-CTERM/EpsH1 system associated)